MLILLVVYTQIFSLLCECQQRPCSCVELLPSHFSLKTHTRDSERLIWRLHSSNKTNTIRRHTLHSFDMPSILSYYKESREGWLHSDADCQTVPYLFHFNFNFFFIPMELAVSQVLLDTASRTIIHLCNVCKASGSLFISCRFRENPSATFWPWIIQCHHY